MSRLARRRDVATAAGRDGTRRDSDRMAMLADPTGAVFGVWQAGQHFGAKLVDEPNSLVWSEVATPDMARTSGLITSPGN